MPLARGGAGRAQLPVGRGQLIWGYMATGRLVKHVSPVHKHTVQCHVMLAVPACSPKSWPASPPQQAMHLSSRPKCAKQPLVGHSVVCSWWAAKAKNVCPPLLACLSLPLLVAVAMCTWLYCIPPSQMLALIKKVNIIASSQK
jgi:hypothetical protein